MDPLLIRLETPDSQMQSSTVRQEYSRISEKSDDASLQVTRLREDLERLYLITQALWQMVKTATGATDEQLQEKIRQIDVEDGRSDGKNTEVTRPIDCPVCHRRILSGQTFCLYCGAEAETSPFRHHGH
ncbi:MAG: hypothetical protein IKR48_05340 [Kiritimatiellae bacterium]|nr:hypothetical protein [Kiritimatiellia bacterium]